MTWTRICPVTALQPERGVAALLGARQIALFRLHDGSLHAVDNVDPVTRAAVLSRGIVGTRGDVPVVVSPMLKQAFDLCSGECLDLRGVRVAVHRVRTVDGHVEIADDAVS